MDIKKPALARIKIKFPDKIWISEIFKKFNDIRMEILNFLPYDLEKSIGNALINIIHYDIDSIIEVIKNHNSVYEFNLIRQEENSIRFNVKTKDPYLLYGVIKCGVLVDFPVNVRDGYAYWRIISTRDRINDLLNLFEEKKLNYSLLKIGNSPYSLEKDETKLTYKELEVLDIAIKNGFFEIPREISLEKLANKIGKSKSALSVMLRKIIKKKILLEN
ncbi:MAG: helix-turn-helix domain-containing protein [Candidatus Lokiarchaeota archaeon]|nr:helix-turn-helix domain-containing protein [Candidatus Lokiarchaeota archaeon]